MFLTRHCLGDDPRCLISRPGGASIGTMAGEKTDEATVQELTEICRELERRGWTGTKIQKWFGGGFNKPFDGTPCWSMCELLSKIQGTVSIVS